ncbi:MAG TPA: hypothetical protein GXZ47_03000 [Treponema sp.]|nr:hypothetical protein [Treponema sp.]
MTNIKQKILFGGAIAILVLAVFAFVFVPALGGSASGKVLEFGKWGGKPIEYVQDSFFVRQIQSLTENLKSRGQEIDQFTHYQVMQSAFTSAVLRLAILDAVDAAEYKPPQSLVNKYLVSYYQDENGKYSAKAFRDTPEITRSARRNLITEELTAQRYISDVFGTREETFGIKVSASETALLQQMAGPQRSFNYVSFSTADYPESETVAFGKENDDFFVKHSFSVITLDSQSAAKKLVKSIAKEETTFTDAITTLSTRIGTSDEGKLLKSYRSDINTLFSDAEDLAAVLALSPGESSQVVMAGKSYAIVRCDEPAVSPDFSDPTVISAIKSYMNLNERGRIEDFYLNQAKAFAETARLSGFDNACEINDLQKYSTTHFGINYGNVELLTPLPVEENVVFSEAVRNESFFKTAFSIEPAAVSNPILLGREIIVLQVSEERAADTQLAEMIPLFYSKYAMSWAEKSVTEAFLASDKLDDKFMETYLEYFLN